MKSLVFGAPTISPKANYVSLPMSSHNTARILYFIFTKKSKQTLWMLYKKTNWTVFLKLLLLFPQSPTSSISALITSSLLEVK